MKRVFLAWLLCWPWAVNAALEDWSCNSLSIYYANVAIDRDNGMTKKDRVNLTVKEIITVMDATDAHMNVDADDAQALISVVEDVYLSRLTALQIKRVVVRACAAGAPIKVRDKHAS